jgi:hypothetical protein
MVILDQPELENMRGGYPDLLLMRFFANAEDQGPPTAVLTSNTRAGIKHWRRFPGDPTF